MLLRKNIHEKDFQLEIEVNIAGKKDWHLDIVQRTKSNNGNLCKR
jgi:hypothetical protein